MIDDGHWSKKLTKPIKLLKNKWRFRGDGVALGRRIRSHYHL